MAYRYCPTCESEYREGITTCVDCGTELVDVEPAAARRADAGEDRLLPHLLAFLGVAALHGLATVLLLPGLVWLALILTRVGYRRRDVLLTMIPLYGVVPYVVAIWRYTAPAAYWRPRDDRPSSALSTGWRRGLTIAGWVVIAVYSGGLVASITSDDTMSDTEWRADFVSFWTDQGYAPETARCAADRVGPGRPYESETDLGLAIEAALAACESARG